MRYNPERGPTPEQEAIYELEQDIAYLKEQLREGALLHKKIDEWNGTYFSTATECVDAF